MKTLITILTLLSYPAMALGIYHKTPNGKYPHYYKEKPTDTPWGEDDQTEYDNLIDQALEKLCFDTSLVAQQKEMIANEKAIGKSTGFVNAQVLHDAGAALVRLKKEIDPLAKIIKDETGKDASTYSCDQGE